MERRVFISHAAGDEDWPDAQVEAVAQAIQDAGIGVGLDLWHARNEIIRPSLVEWMQWMDEEIDHASHVLCLVSPQYSALWKRRRGEAGGYGVAFEAVHLIHALYLQKQHNKGHILTLRPAGHGFDSVPRLLLPNCSHYDWGVDRAQLISDLERAPLRVAGAAPGAGRPAVAPVSPAAPPAPAGKPAAKRPAWASASGQDPYGHWADLTVNDVTQRMRWIPPTGPEGFWMGSPAAERAAIRTKDIREWAEQHEHAPRREQVTTGFWLADTPCTQAFWRAVADVDPSHFSTGAEAPERPVESVSWDDVMDQFIARLAARPGWGPGDTLRLPTEVEWEYAARAGTRTAYWWGEDWDNARGNAWQSLGTTSPVKRFAPNPLGLHDVHGNVWEWCADVWQPRRHAPEARPDADWRVVRGGSWFHHPGIARAAYRLGWRRRNAYQHQGFRFALRSPVGPEAR